MVYEAQSEYGSLQLYSIYIHIYLLGSSRIFNPSRNLSLLVSSPTAVLYLYTSTLLHVWALNPPIHNSSSTLLGLTLLEKRIRNLTNAILNAKKPLSLTIVYYNIKFHLKLNVWICLYIGILPYAYTFVNITWRLFIVLILIQTSLSYWRLFFFFFIWIQVCRVNIQIPHKSSSFCDDFTILSFTFRRHLSCSNFNLAYSLWLYNFKYSFSWLYDSRNHYSLLKSDKQVFHAWK